MDIIFILTIRHLRQNLKRTLSTVGGILAASIMITMAAVFINSYLDILNHAEISAGDIAPLLTAAAVAMAVLLAVLVIFLYNMLSLSAQERIRYLGMLGSVGATPFQRGNLSLLEAALLGIAGIPAGIFTGCLFSILLFPFQVIISWKMLLFILFCELLSVFFTGMLQAVLSSRGTVIELLKNRTDKRNLKKQVSVPGWLMARFGIEGHLAFKNILFFKRRYLAIGVSFIISMILFLNGYICMNYIDGYYTVQDRSRKEFADITVEEETAEEFQNNGISDRDWNSFTSDIASLPEVESFTRQEKVNFNGILLDEETIHPDMSGGFSVYELAGYYNNPVTIYDKENNTKKGVCMNLTLIGMDEDSFQRYMEKSGISGSIHSKDGMPPVLILDHALAENDRGIKYQSILKEELKGKLTVISDTDRNMTGFSPDFNPVSSFQELSFDVLGVTNQFPSEYNIYDSVMNESNTLYFYTTASAFETFIKENHVLREDERSIRSLSLKIKSGIPDVTDNLLNPVTTHLGNTYYRSLKLTSSSLQLMTDDTLQQNIRIRSDESAKIQEKIRKAGEKYGLSDGMNLVTQKYDFDTVNYTMSSYSAAVEGALADPVPILRHLFLYGILIFLSIISIFQMLKMTLASMQMRRREFAVFLSLGMNRRQIGKMVFWENAACSILSFAAGLISSVSITVILFKTWEKEQAVEMIFPYHIILWELIVLILLLAASLAASVGSARKVNLIDVIKEDSV